MTESLRKKLWILTAVVGATSLVIACTDDCMQIQDQLCYCQGQTQTEQSTCQSNASTQENNNPPTTAQIAHCKTLLPGCTALIDGGTGCSLLQKPEGAQICGLSALPDAG